MKNLSMYIFITGVVGVLVGTAQVTISPDPAPILGIGLLLIITGIVRGLYEGVEGI